MLPIRHFSILFVVFMVIFCSCNEQDKIEIEKSASAFDIKQGEASILQSNQHFMKSFKAGDTAEVAQCFTSNGKVMAANQPAVTGRKDLGHFFSNMIKTGVANFKLTTLKVWGDSTILVEEGNYELSDHKDHQVDKGEYIALWQQESGNWKMYRVIWTSALPASAIKIEGPSMPSH